MQAIDLLLKRQSTQLLTTPAPSTDDVDKLLAAGMRVPDHAGLKPWYFHVISGQGLQRLSDLYVSAYDELNKHSTDIDEEAYQAKREKTAKMPFRAPMIIVISTKYTQHNKVPKQEQLVAAGCCAHAMQMAAYALGYGAMWRTGDLAYDNLVKKGLGIDEADDIAGFLYVGSPSKSSNSKPAKPFNDHVTYWQ